MDEAQHTESNHVVRLTGAGAGAIAVVRICGPATEVFLREHFSRPAQRGKLNYGIVSDGPRTLDDVIVAVADHGQSADLNLHGGPWVITSVMDLCERSGFVRTNTFTPAGELASFAVDGADWSERQMLRALPKATTALAVRMLLAQPAAWRALIALAANQPEVFRVRARMQIDDESGHWLLHPPSVAILGIPNAGKSTLANCLYGQARSITGDVPGTTRDWVADLADIDGVPVLLHDMPGFRSTPDPIEQEAIRVAEERVKTADLLILVLDGSRLDDPEQQSLQAAYPKAMRVLNKADRAVGLGSDVEILRTIATTGVGIDAVRRAIAAHFDCADLDLAKPRWWSALMRELLLRAVDDPRVLESLK